MERKQHWEHIYQTKDPSEVSWHQPVPTHSLHLIAQCGLPKSARIIDIGGGDSLLADFLLAEGYTDITVLDISGEALRKAQKRLGDRAASVHWIESDIGDFTPHTPFDLWHDRATFHFLTGQPAIDAYIASLQQGIRPGGHAILGTFSDQGPTKCSGLDIRQYSPQSLAHTLGSVLDPVHCQPVTHITPSGASQHFTFCRFGRKQTA